MDIEIEKLKIREKFGKHIPSLLPEIRDQKIDELIN